MLSSLQNLILVLSIITVLFDLNVQIYKPVFSNKILNKCEAKETHRLVDMTHYIGILLHTEITKLNSAIVI